DLAPRRRAGHAGRSGLLGRGQGAAGRGARPPRGPRVADLPDAGGSPVPLRRAAQVLDGPLPDARSRGVAHPPPATMVGRHAHKAELIRVITERLAARTAAEWEARFAEADVPCTRVRSVPEMLVDPQALLNGTLATVEHPTLGPVRSLGVPRPLADTPR